MKISSQSMTTINKIHLEDFKGLLTLKMSDFRTEDEKVPETNLLDINEQFFSAVFKKHLHSTLRLAGCH